MVEFCGLMLRNPIIAAPSPATENIKNILECANVGVGAIILKSTGPEKIVKKNKFAPRRMFFRDGTLFMLSSSRREILDFKTGLHLLRQAKKKVQIPIIASVCGLCDEMDEWQDICIKMAENGADMIQIDPIYTTEFGDIISEKLFRNIVKVAREVKNSINKPVMVKLNNRISINTAVRYLKGKDIAVSLLDSIPVGIPIDVASKNFSNFRGVKKHGKCLAAGKILYPLALLYTQELSRNGVGPICAGGGVFSGSDAASLLLSGAAVVQIATSICVHGFKVISKIISELNLISHRYKIDFNTCGRRFIMQNIGYEETEVIPGKVFHGVMEGCATCQEKPCYLTVMCNSNEKKCEGCGLCIDVCPKKIAFFKEVKLKWR